MTATPSRPALFTVESSVPTRDSSPVAEPQADIDVHQHHHTMPTESDGNGLAVRLRKATALAHHEVMQPAIVGKLVSGQLPQDIHLRYLMMLYSVYTTLEQGLLEHASNPHLASTYDPALLARADALDRDIAFYTGDVEWVTSGSSKIWSDVQAEKGSALAQYVGRLNELTQRNPTLLLAHAYVRYLGDLSGGQQIARTIRKSYSLPESGEGSAFYEFFLPPTPTSSGLPVRAGLNETKEIKNWFRTGLDEAGSLMTEEENAAVIAEARLAFELNIGVFKSFEQTMKEWEAEHKVNGVEAPRSAGAATPVGSKGEKGGAVVDIRGRTHAVTFWALAVALLLATVIAVRDWHFTDMLSI